MVAGERWSAPQDEMESLESFFTSQFVISQSLAVCRDAREGGGNSARSKAMLEGFSKSFQPCVSPELESH